jgi:2-polyprenyl-3-methyl-5-hydroxy-6-metoxy-1,4-benzoquinol methylase
MYATIDDLRSQLGAPESKVSPEYAAKMLHAVPDAEVVDRAKFILERCKGQVVLDVGASGPMHEAIVKVAAKVYGIDRQDGDGVVGIDLDDYHAALPVFADVTRIVCGEVLEHLSNPGWFLKRLRDAYRCETIITVPNAFAEAGRGQLKRGTEVVNRDHVAWYSYKTLSVLLERHGYAVKQFYWYGGQPYTSEGLIVVTE